MSVAEISSGSSRPNNRQKRLARRVLKFWNFFLEHPEEKFTLKELCVQTGCDPGALSRTAIPILRSLAEHEGWQFPPAVPATGFAYVLTKDPGKGLDPKIHMGLIKHGVARREKKLGDWIGRDFHLLSPGDIPTARMMIRADELREELEKKVDKFAADVLRDLVVQRREERSAK